MAFGDRFSPNDGDVDRFVDAFSSTGARVAVGVVAAAIVVAFVFFAVRSVVG